MAQVPGYNYDIFISYAHDDNVRIGGGEGWVDTFHDSLQNWLRHRRGLKSLAIWRDPTLGGNTLFDDAIRETIDGSAIFLVLHTRNYQASDYCRKELERLHGHNQTAQRSLRVGNDSRIFNVLLTNIPHREWPEQLSATSGFPMHDAMGSDAPGEFTSTRQPQLRDAAPAHRGRDREDHRGPHRGAIVSARQRDSRYRQPAAPLRPGLLRRRLRRPGEAAGPTRDRGQRSRR